MKMVPLFQVLLMVLVSNSHTAGSAFFVNLIPKNPLFRWGEESRLICQAGYCSEEVNFMWRSLEDKPMYAEIQKSSFNQSTLIFKNITQNHENSILCSAKCGNEVKEDSASVRVFSFHQDPIISGHDRLELGKQANLICELPHVYPLYMLEVKWLRSGSEVKSDTESIRSIYNFTPQSEDDGKEITCEAFLDCERLEPEQKTRQTTVTMSVLSAPHNMQVSALSEVLLGSTLTLKCEADGNPKPAFSWRYLGPANSSMIMGEAQNLTLFNVTLSDAGNYECEANNDMGKTTAVTSVTVHGPPVNTAISVSPNGPKEEELLTITCTSDSSPRSNLELSRVQDGSKTVLVSDNGPLVSMNRNASLSDSGLYVCRASNAYGHQTTQVHINVKAHPLEVFLKPNVSVIAVERGSSMTLFCEASGCPHSSIVWRNVMHSSTLRQSDLGTTVSQLGPWNVQPSDDGEFTCEVRCSSVVKSRSTMLKIFSFPSDPVIESSGTFLEGNASTLTCTVQDIYPANCFRIQWLDGSTELRYKQGSYSDETQTISLPISYQPEGGVVSKTLTCRVLLEMDHVSREKTTSKSFTVHHAPKHTSITVTPRNELKAGELLNISCTTDSFPAGSVILKVLLDRQETVLVSSEGNQTSYTVPSAQLSDSGLYVCEAFNEHGHQTDRVQITVQAPPRNTTVTVYPSTIVQEGQNVTICCQSISFPPPAVILRKMDSGVDIYSPNGTFLLINLQPNDTGLYQINVTNALGYETEIISIHVMEKQSSSPPSYTDFIIPAIGLVMLVSVVSVLEYLRRARRRGFYKLTEKHRGSL